MQKYLVLITLMFTLLGCSEGSTEPIDDSEGDQVAEEKNSVEKISLSSLEVEEDLEKEADNNESDNPLDPFWEVYEGDEIIHAVSGGEKTYDFELEAGPFEDAIIESMESDDEDMDWSPYFASFTANASNQSPEGYMSEMYMAYEEFLNPNYDKDKIIEHILNAKEIRESSE